MKRKDTVVDIRQVYLDALNDMNQGKETTVEEFKVDPDNERKHREFNEKVTRYLCAQYIRRTLIEFMSVYIKYKHDDR